MPITLIIVIALTCLSIVWFLVGIYRANKAFWKEEKRKEAERNRKWWNEAGDEEAKQFYENCKN